MAGTPARVEVHGDLEMRRALKRMEGRLDRLREVHEDAGSVVESEARQLVPVRSGRLRNTIRMSIRLASRTSGGSKIIAGRGSLVPYAGPIHFGWRARNIEPQPFLYDALDRRRGEVFDRYQDGIADLVRTVGREGPH